MKTHSPIIFVLLLCATLGIHAISISWLNRGSVTSLASVFYDAIVSAELAVVCVWATFTRVRGMLAAGGVVVAVLLACAPAVWLDLLSLGEAGGIYGVYSAMLLALLWTLRRTAYWQRLSGQSPVAWQFSMAIVLIAPMVLAILVVALRDSSFVAAGSELWRFLTALTFSDLLIVLVTTVIWAFDAHWIFRLAGAIAAGSLVGFTEAVAAARGWLGIQVAPSFQQPTIDFVAYAIILICVLFAWLELVPLVPHYRRAAQSPPAGDAS